MISFSSQSSSLLFLIFLLRFFTSFLRAPYTDTEANLTMAYIESVFYHQTVALTVAMLILSTTSVVLRFLARRKKQAQLKGDDLWAFLALVGFGGYVGVLFYGNHTPPILVTTPEIGYTRFAEQRSAPST